MHRRSGVAIQSERNRKRAVKLPLADSIEIIQRRASGTYRRDAGDGEHVEIVIAERVYRIRRGELRPG